MSLTDFPRPNLEPNIGPNLEIKYPKCREKFQFLKIDGKIRVLNVKQFCLFHPVKFPSFEDSHTIFLEFNSPWHKTEKGSKIPAFIFFRGKHIVGGIVFYQHIF